MLPERSCRVWQETKSHRGENSGIWKVMCTHVDGARNSRCVFGAKNFLQTTKTPGKNFSCTALFHFRGVFGEFYAIFKFRKAQRFYSLPETEGCGGIFAFFRLYDAQKSNQINRDPQAGARASRISLL